MKRMEIPAALMLLLGALPFAACDCAAIGSSKTGLDIVLLEVESTDPPADPRGGEWVVVPGAEITLGWGLPEQAEEVILAAHDEVIGRWNGKDAPSRFVDTCTPSRCSTEREGLVVYTLTAIFSKEDKIADSRSVKVMVSPAGLQILSFQVAPSRLSPGEEAILSWQTSGAVSVEVFAMPASGGAKRSLANHLLPEAHQGQLSDAAWEATRFEILATSPSGTTSMASATVAFGTDAFFTEVKVDPPLVHPGKTATLSWKAVGLSGLAILRDDGEPPILGIDAAEALEGSRTVTVHGAVRFLFVGTSSEGEPIQELCDGTGCMEAAVSVGLRPRAKVRTFVADPPSIEIGSSTTLRFHVEEAEELRISWQEDGNPMEETLDPAARAFVVSPKENTNYTLHAISQGVVASTAMAPVRVTPRVRLFVETDPGTKALWAGETTRISWTTLGADTLQLDVGGVATDIAGLDLEADAVVVPVPDLPDGTRLPIVLSALRNQTLATATVEVMVHRRPGALSASFQPAQVPRGSTSTLAWSAPGAQSVWSSPPLPTVNLVEPWVDLDLLQDQPILQEQEEVQLPFPWPSPLGFASLTVHREGALTLGTGALPLQHEEIETSGGVIFPLRGDFASDAATHVLYREETDRVIVEWRGLLLDGERATFQSVLRSDGHLQIGWKTLPSGDLQTELFVDPQVPGLQPLPFAWAGTPWEGGARVFTTGPLPQAGTLEVHQEASFHPLLQGWSAAQGVISSSRPGLQVR